MITNITYENKAPFNDDKTIPDKNKVNAKDMNEIKKSINDNAEELISTKTKVDTLKNYDDTELKEQITILKEENKQLLNQIPYRTSRRREFASRR